MTAGQSQRSIIVAHPDFERTWPWAADHFRVLWEAQGQTEFLRLAPDDRRPVSEIVADPAGVTRLVALNVRVTVECVARMQALREAVFSPGLPTEVGETRWRLRAYATTCNPARASGGRASPSSPSRSRYAACVASRNCTASSYPTRSHGITLRPVVSDNRAPAASSSATTRTSP